MASGTPPRLTFASAAATPASANTPRGPQVITYDPSVYKNSQLAQYLNGRGDAGSYFNLGKGSSYSKLGIELPSPAAMNYGRALNVERMGESDLARGFYNEQNRNYDQEVGIAKEWAPVGQYYYNPGMIRSYR